MLTDFFQFQFQCSVCFQGRELRVVEFKTAQIFRFRFQMHVNCQSYPWSNLQIENVMNDSWFTFNEFDGACISDGIRRQERTCDYGQCVSVDINGIASISYTGERYDPSCFTHGNLYFLITKFT